MSNVMHQYEMLKSKVINRKTDFDRFIVYLEKETEWLVAPVSSKFHCVRNQIGISKCSCQKSLLSASFSFIVRGRGAGYCLSLRAVCRCDNASVATKALSLHYFPSMLTVGSFVIEK